MGWGAIDGVSSRFIPFPLSLMTRSVRNRPQFSEGLF